MVRKSKKQKQEAEVHKASPGGSIQDQEQCDTTHAATYIQNKDFATGRPPDPASCRPTVSPDGRPWPGDMVKLHHGRHSHVDPDNYHLLPRNPLDKHHCHPQHYDSHHTYRRVSAFGIGDAIPLEVLHQRLHRFKKQRSHPAHEQDRSGLGTAFDHSAAYSSSYQNAARYDEAESRRSDNDGGFHSSYVGEKTTMDEQAGQSTPLLSAHRQASAVLPDYPSRSAGGVSATHHALTALFDTHIVDWTSYFSTVLVLSLLPIPVPGASDTLASPVAKSLRTKEDQDLVRVKYAFIFDYGSVVLFNCSLVDEQLVLQFVSHYIEDPLTAGELKVGQEVMSYYHSPECSFDEHPPHAASQAAHGTLNGASGLPSNNDIHDNDDDDEANNLRQRFHPSLQDTSPVRSSNEPHNDAIDNTSDHGHTHDDNSSVLATSVALSNSNLTYPVMHHSQALDHVHAITNDIITLATLSPFEKLSVAYALAQCVKMNILEDRLERQISANRSLPEQLAQYGSIKMSRSALSKRVGELFLHRNNINLHKDILDTPEFFWEYDEFKQIYDSLSRYLEFKQRILLMNTRLAILKELLNIISSQLDTEHGEKLEWIIIYLILIEVFAIIFWQILIKDILGFFK